MEDKGFRRCKNLMIFFNLLFMLGGLVLAGLGVWVVVDYNSFSSTLSTNALFQYAAFIFIGVGAAIAVVSFLGCCGAWKENKCLLVTFIIVIILFLLIEIAVLILAFLFTSTLEQLLRQGADASIKIYTNDVTDPVTSGWDSLQVAFSCCGYINGTDYTGSLYDAQSSTVQPWPASCCVKNGDAYLELSACQNSATVSAVNTFAQTGCFQALRDLVMRYAGVTGGVTAGVMALQILAVIFACCVTCGVKHNKVHETWSY